MHCVCGTELDSQQQVGNKMMEWMRKKRWKNKENICNETNTKVFAILYTRIHYVLTQFYAKGIKKFVVIFTEDVCSYCWENNKSTQKHTVKIFANQHTTHFKCVLRTPMLLSFRFSLSPLPCCQSWTHHSQPISFSTHLHKGKIISFSHLCMCHLEEVEWTSGVWKSSQEWSWVPRKCFEEIFPFSFRFASLFI